MYKYQPTRHGWDVTLCVFVRYNYSCLQVSSVISHRRIGLPTSLSCCIAFPSKQVDSDMMMQSDNKGSRQLACSGFKPDSLPDNSHAVRPQGKSGSSGFSALSLCGIRKSEQNNLPLSKLAAKLPLLSELCKLWQSSKKSLLSSRAYLLLCIYLKNNGLVIVKNIKK